MRQRDVAALDAKYTKELADAKAENDALRDDVAAGRRRLHIKAVYPVSAWSHHRLRRGYYSLPDWQTPLNGIISPSERLITMQKQLGASILMSSARVICPYRWATHTMCEQYARCDINADNATEQSFTNVL